MFVERFNRRLFISLLFIIIQVVCLLSCKDRRAIGENIPDCDIDKGACIRNISTDNITVTFDIGPKPLKSMSELFFAVTVMKNRMPVKDAVVSVELTMPGMFMGINKPALSHSTNGIYTGKGVIPRCPAGSRIWKAEVFIERKGGVSTVSYVFEVTN